MTEQTPFIDAAVVALADDAIERAQRNIGATRTIRGKKRRRVATGKLIQSLIYTSNSTKSFNFIRFTTTPDTQVYAGVIEYGRRKGARQPPTSAILKWMDEKNIRIQKKGGGFIKSTPALKKSVAFLIARAIKRDGIEGINYYTDAINAAVLDAGDEMRDAMGKEIITRLRLK